MTALERAARAIHGVDQRRDPIVPDWEWVSQDAYMSMARAVLMAVRDEMRNERNGKVFNRSSAATVDAILNEKDTAND